MMNSWAVFSIDFSFSLSGFLFVCLFVCLFLLLQTKMLQIFAHKSLYRHRHLFHLSKYLEAEWLDNMVSVCLTI